MSLSFQEGIYSCFLFYWWRKIKGNLTKSSVTPTQYMVLGIAVSFRVLCSVTEKTLPLFIPFYPSIPFKTSPHRTPLFATQSVTIKSPHITNRYEKSTTEKPFLAPWPWSLISSGNLTKNLLQIQESHGSVGNFRGDSLTVLWSVKRRWQKWFSCQRLFHSWSYRGLVETAAESCWEVGLILITQCESQFLWQSRLAEATVYPRNAT